MDGAAVKEPNIYEKQLDSKLVELESCQSEKGVDSCLKCEKIIGCELRNSYVDAVYQSMNGGESGHFDFDG